MTARPRLSPPFTDVVAYGERPFPSPQSAGVSTGSIKLSGGANAAAGYAEAAQASADAAAASANAAAASAAGVASSVTAAANSATAAANSASNAASSAVAAEDAEDAALGYSSAAAASAANAAVSYSSFRNMYYGPAAADPATRPDTTPRVTGDLYYRTSAPLGMKVWSGSAWSGAFVGEAPTDGQQYARQNATWAVVTGGGGGGGIPEAPADSKEYVRYNSAWIALDWSILDGKPSTFPYATPIPQTDVQNLVSNLAAKQASDTTLTALAALDATAGLLEQTGSDAFAKRAMGVGASTSILTRADGDGRYLGDAPSDGTTYGRKNAAWVATAAGGASITISDTAPSTPAAGALWWESDTGKLWIYYNDGTSSQWVEAAAPAVGHNITISTFDPSGGNDGDVWYKVA